MQPPDKSAGEDEDWDVCVSLSVGSLHYYSSAGNNAKIKTLETMFFRELRGVKQPLILSFARLAPLMLLAAAAADAIFFALPLYADPGRAALAPWVAAAHAAVCFVIAAVLLVRTRGVNATCTLRTLHAEQLLLLLLSAVWTVLVVMRRLAYWHHDHAALRPVGAARAALAFDREGGTAVSLLLLYIVLTICSSRYSFSLKLIVAHMVLSVGLVVYGEVVWWGYAAAVPSSSGVTEEAAANDRWGLALKCAQQIMLLGLTAAASAEWLYLKQWDE